MDSHNTKKYLKQQLSRFSIIYRYTYIPPMVGTTDTENNVTYKRVTVNNVGTFNRTCMSELDFRPKPIPGH